MVQLNLSDQFHCLLRCGLYQMFDGITQWVPIAFTWKFCSKCRRHLSLNCIWKSHNQHIEAGTKWLTFCRKRFQIHFLKCKFYTVETLYSTIYYSKYFIELNFDKSTQYVALWTHKRHPIPRPFGQAMECLLWVLQQKLTVLWRVSTVLWFKSHQNLFLGVHLAISSFPIGTDSGNGSVTSQYLNHVD